MKTADPNYYKNYHRNRRRQRFADGLCVDCPNQRLPDRVRCEVCAEIAVDREMGRYYLRQLAKESR